MTRYDRMELGRCDFLDVLEESVLMQARVKVELLEGGEFEDQIRDVITRDGEEEVHFDRHDPVLLRQIAAIHRTPLPRTYPPDLVKEPAPGREG